MTYDVSVYFPTKPQGLDAFMRARHFRKGEVTPAGTTLPDEPETHRYRRGNQASDFVVDFRYCDGVFNDMPRNYAAFGTLSTAHGADDDTFRVLEKVARDLTKRYAARVEDAQRS